MINPDSSIITHRTKRFPLPDEKVIMHRGNSDTKPRVTIGMPTYRRADTIDRALLSVCRQSFREFKLIVSDNAGHDDRTVDAVERASISLPEVLLIAQDKNIGALANLHRILELADTEYFMWLADDDEITPTYLSDLVRLLDENAACVGAMGKWKKMESPYFGAVKKQMKSNQTSRTARVFRYIAFCRDDALFYGLHRTDILRRGRFNGFFWPNKAVLTNRCFLFIFDLVWQGPMAYSETATLISHNYTEKHYCRSMATSVSDRLRTLVRRANVFLVYCYKATSYHPPMLLVAAPASIIGFTLDLATATRRIVVRLLTEQSVR